MFHIQTQLGHKSLAMTERYSHFVEGGLKDVTRAIEREWESIAESQENK